ncbi:MULTISPECIES: MlaD family protein [unclassified Flavobacterium]|uniref:MlaD family protein n=1 Tax=unclassified Flavobacterium TaxID=196869 RepID=UPI001F12E659|nr:MULTISPECIES: MlaD family protein [unclassified Flavobacterium]UMY65221.1 MlaD family protein [Flavobacterium sp. HJ-32-4]
MNTQSTTFKVRLGLFVFTGIVLFFLALFLIGKQKNLFNPVFQLRANFRNVGGLQVGNVVRFSGINIGTVDNIRILNDTTVRVDMLIRQDVKPFIKEDARAGIGSEGIIGDKVLVLSQGNSTHEIKPNQLVASNEPTDMDAVMRSLSVTADNAAVASEEMAEILLKINRGDGTLGRLIQDKEIAENLDKTMENLKNSSKGLEENMEAAKHNFLLRGYFKKKEKEKREKEEAAKKEAKEAAAKASKKATKK